MMAASVISKVRDFVIKNDKGSESDGILLKDKEKQLKVVWMEVIYLFASYTDQHQVDFPVFWTDQGIRRDFMSV